MLSVCNINHTNNKSKQLYAYQFKLHVYYDCANQIERLRSNLKADDLFFKLVQKSFNSVISIKFYIQFELIYHYCNVFFAPITSIDTVAARTNNKKGCKDKEMFYSCCFGCRIFLVDYVSWYMVDIETKKQNENIHATCATRFAS